MPNLKIVTDTNIRSGTDVKRFYIPGVVLTSNCPHCGESQSRDMGEHYLSYPETNSPVRVHFYHETKEDSQGRSESHEWSEEVILSITLSEVK